MPILDGSAAPWLALLEPRPQGGVRPVVRLPHAVRVADGPGFVEAVPAPAFSARVEVVFPGLGPMVAADVQAAADARTFGFLKDAEGLRASGRALGASLETTVVFDDHGRCLNPGGLRGADEPARHKLLDLLGDLALLGGTLAARVTAHRAGHALHHAFARAVEAVATSTP
ncbi:MAG: UDP-3-O-acyl-N-acetylglucosamine deacetylase [bacterium]